MDDNKRKFDNIIKDVFQIDDIDENMTRDNTKAWDSMTHLMLITSIEDEFDIMLDAEDILNFKSYNDGLAIIKKYGTRN